MYSGGVKLGRIVACPDNKTEQQKVELYYEDDPFCPSSYIIYPCSELSNSLSQIPPPQIFVPPWIVASLQGPWATAKLPQMAQ